MSEEKIKKIKVLSVDPEPHISNLIRLCLDRKRYDVDFCQTVIDALKKARYGKYDIIITEVVFSGINGYEFAKRLRTWKTTKHTPIIILSFKGQMNDKLHAIDCGVDDYMTKPFDPDELERHIKLNIGSST